MHGYMILRNIVNFMSLYEMYMYIRKINTGENYLPSLRACCRIFEPFKTISAYFSLTVWSLL